MPALEYDRLQGAVLVHLVLANATREQLLPPFVPFGGLDGNGDIGGVLANVTTQKTFQGPPRALRIIRVLLRLAAGACPKMQ